MGRNCLFIDFYENRLATAVTLKNIDAALEMIIQNLYVTYHGTEASLKYWYHTNTNYFAGYVKNSIPKNFANAIRLKYTRGTSKLVYNIVIDDETWTYFMNQKLSHNQVCGCSKTNSIQ